MRDMRVMMEVYDDILNRHQVPNDAGTTISSVRRFTGS